MAKVPASNVKFLIDEHNSIDALLKYANECKQTLSIKEFFENVELPFIRTRIKECKESHEGNLLIYFIDRARKINSIIIELKETSQSQQVETETEQEVRLEINKMYNIPFENLDIDNYVNWVLGKKQVTRNQKKEHALSLLGLREKTISNYRNIISEIFYKTTYWKEPTEQEKENFPLWRESQYNREKDFFNLQITDNPLPMNEIKRQEKLRVYDNLNKLHQVVLKDLYNTWLPKDFYSLALLAGKIDYLKFLSIENNTTTPKAKPVFKLSDKKGAKTDLIRVLNALYEIRLFNKTDGQIPTKQEFFETMGEYLGVDLSKYHTNLSQALQNQPLEVNLKVFEDMKEATQNAHYQTKNK
jgi:hypothetical protein